MSQPVKKDVTKSDDDSKSAYKNRPLRVDEDNLSSCVFCLFFLHKKRVLSRLQLVLLH